jgi:general secretion pathway protein A
MTAAYETFFGLGERPFSLTADARYFYEARSHAHALQTMMAGLASADSCLVVTGDVGVGKTMLCSTLAERLGAHTSVSVVPNPVLEPGALFRLLLDDLFGDDAAAPPEAARLTDPVARDLLVDLLAARRQRGERAPVVILDDAHTLPAGLVDHIVSLALQQHDGEGGLLRFVLVGFSRDDVCLGIPALDDLVAVKARLQPLDRDDCARYVAHRLAIAGRAGSARFTPQAINVLYGVSGGVPRLINLLCERALRESRARGAHDIEPAVIQVAAGALQLVRARPRRFRWFGRHVS